MAKIVSLINLKGGVGKTTMTVRVKVFYPPNRLRYADIYQ